MPVVELPAPLVPDLTVYSERRWYEEQVVQARAFRDILREQERAALAYLASIQTQREAAEERLRQSEQIAAEWRTHQGGLHAR